MVALLLLQTVEDLAKHQFCNACADNSIQQPHICDDRSCATQRKKIDIVMTQPSVDANILSSALLNNLQLDYDAHELLCYIVENNGTLGILERTKPRIRGKLLNLLCKTHWTHVYEF